MMSLTNEQKKELKGWGINPKDIKLPNNPIWSKLAITCVFSLLAGAFLFAVFIFSGLSPDFLTDGQCLELNHTSQSHKH